MLVLLGRRDSRVFDYYAQQGLRLDPAEYQIGAGTGAWVETNITEALLETPTMAYVPRLSSLTLTGAGSRCGSTTVMATVVGAAGCCTGECRYR
jgi:hypothetical protein